MGRKATGAMKLTGFTQNNNNNRADPANRSRIIRFALLYGCAVVPIASVLLLIEYIGDVRENIGIVSFLAVNTVAIALLAWQLFDVLKEHHDICASAAALSHDQKAKSDALAGKLAQQIDALAAVQQIIGRLSQCVTVKDLLTISLKESCDLLGFDVGVAWLRDDTQQLRLIAQTGLIQNGELSLNKLPEHSLTLQQALSSDQPTIIRSPDLPIPPSILSLPSAGPIGLLIVPIVSSGTNYGAMGLVCRNSMLCDERIIQPAKALGAYVGVVLEHVQRYEEARRLVDRDPITGLQCQRAIIQRMEQELKRARRTGQQFSVVLMDLDGFRLFNDTYGLAAGDKALKIIASLLLREGRGSDHLGRYGGDDFVVILPNTGAEGALALAERLRSSLAKCPYITSDGLEIPLRMSFGISTYPDNGRKVSELMAFADANLDQSKQKGGDTITVMDSFGRDSLANMGTFSVLDGLVTAVDHKDHYTRKHSEDVTTYSLAIGRAMGLSGDQLQTLQIAGLLHDVGKIGVPDCILRKPGRLNPEEFNIIKQHVVLGELIIKEVPNIPDVLAAVGSHHERIDGSGYPRGLKGDEIPLLGRILAVADAYSAMTTKRPYHLVKDPKEAQAELMRVAGVQLDGRVVEVFLKILAEGVTDLNTTPAITQIGKNGDRGESTLLMRGCRRGK